MPAARLAPQRKIFAMKLPQHAESGKEFPPTTDGLETPADYIPALPAALYRCPWLPSTALRAYAVLRRWHMSARKRGKAVFQINTRALAHEIGRTHRTTQQALWHLRGAPNKHGELTMGPRDENGALIEPVVLLAVVREGSKGRYSWGALLKLPDAVLEHARDPAKFSQSSRERVPEIGDPESPKSAPVQGSEVETSEQHVQGAEGAEKPEEQGTAPPPGRRIGPWEKTGTEYLEKSWDAPAFHELVDETGYVRTADGPRGERNRWRLAQFAGFLMAQGQDPLEILQKLIQEMREKYPPEKCSPENFAATFAKMVHQCDPDDDRLQRAVEALEAEEKAPEQGVDSSPPDAQEPEDTDDDQDVPGLTLPFPSGQHMDAPCPDIPAFVPEGIGQIIQGMMLQDPGADKARQRQLRADRRERESWRPPRPDAQEVAL